MTKRVLIVEDCPDLQMILQTWLEMAGYTTTLAQDGLEALELLESARPSVILLDLGLPRMDGYAFLEALRQREGATSPPVIVLTADPQATSKLAHTSVKVFTKPYSFEVLLIEIATHVNAIECTAQ